MDENSKNKVEYKYFGFKELSILAKRFGFKNIFDFSIWVEDNNLANVLGIKGEEDDESEILKEDIDSRKYKAKFLALKILRLPEAQEQLKLYSDDIRLDKWQDWARKARKEE